MDNEMINRVADKLKSESGLTINIELFWLHLASVAIKAMREPTEKMKLNNAVYEQTSNELWQSMIDAIINE